MLPLPVQPAQIKVVCSLCAAVPHTAERCSLMGIILALAFMFGWSGGGKPFQIPKKSEPGKCRIMPIGPPQDVSKNPKVSERK